MNKLRVAGIQAEPLNLHFEQVFEVGVDEVRATCSAAGVRGGWLAGGCPCRCRCRSEALPAAPTSPACTAATASTTEAVHLFAIPLQMSWDDLSKNDMLWPSVRDVIDYRRQVSGQTALLRWPAGCARIGHRQTCRLVLWRTGTAQLHRPALSSRPLSPACRSIKWCGGTSRRIPTLTACPSPG